jgi:hypothetical protein
MPGGVRLELGIIRPCYSGDSKPGFPICLYSKRKPRLLLGRHKNKSSALRQERMIQMVKKARKKAR